MDLRARLIFDTAEPETGAFPPAPHDPREREHALTVSGWEVRVFGGRKFEYFVGHGLWHVQLWHPRAGISVLTPSLLTNGQYEAFPVDAWKWREPTYGTLVRMLRKHHGEAFLRRDELALIERAFVADVVKTRTSAAS